MKVFGPNSVLPTAGAAVAHVLVCTLIAWRFTTARRRTPEPFDGGAMQVSFASRDGAARIDGWHLEAPAQRPAVVFVHGKDGCRGEELKSPTFALARRFAEAGVAVLMIEGEGEDGVHGGGRWRAMAPLWRADARVSFSGSQTGAGRGSRAP